MINYPILIIWPLKTPIKPLFLVNAPATLLVCFPLANKKNLRPQRFRVHSDLYDEKQSSVFSASAAQSSPSTFSSIRPLKQKHRRRLFCPIVAQPRGRWYCRSSSDPHCAALRFVRVKTTKRKSPQSCILCYPSATITAREDQQSNPREKRHLPLQDSLSCLSLNHTSCNSPMRAEEIKT